MKAFDISFTKVDAFIAAERKPDFDNLIKVLSRKKPARPTLFEYFMCEEIYAALTKHIHYDNSDELSASRRTIDAFRIAGYDYATVTGSDFHFHSNRQQKEGSRSISLNEGSIITDRESFQSFPCRL